MKGEEGKIMDERLVKYLLGEASESERMQVQHWLDASEDNRKYYEGFRLIWEESSALAPTDSADANAAWERFKQKTGTRRSDTRIIAYKWTAIAAALLLLVTAIRISYLVPKKGTIEGIAQIHEQVKPEVPAPASDRTTQPLATPEEKKKDNADNTGSVNHKHNMAHTGKEKIANEEKKAETINAQRPYPLGDSALLAATGARSEISSSTGYVRQNSQALPASPGVANAGISNYVRMENAMPDSTSSGGITSLNKKDTVKTGTTVAAAKANRRGLALLSRPKSAIEDAATAAQKAALGSNITVQRGAGKGTFIIKGPVDGAPMQEGKVWLVITDLPGKTVYTDSLLLSHGQLNAKIQMPGNTPAGVYLLNLKADSLNYFTKITVE